MIWKIYLDLNLQNQDQKADTKTPVYRCLCKDNKFLNNETK